MVKKIGLKLDSSDLIKMLPELYHQIITSQLTAAEYITLQMLVNLIQTYKNLQIEKIAAH